jgi:hypothetical protein
VNSVQRSFALDSGTSLKLPLVEVVTAQGRWPLELDGEWFNDVDVLWSPDSDFLALTGDMNGYTESIRVFAITQSGPVKLNASLQPARDMLRRFPPCRARHSDIGCPDDSSDIGLNFAAIAWSDSHILVLMSEVPCDSIWGGIMCQVMGYEVNLPSGRIVRALPATAFQKKWQHAMAWKFRIPEPPEWKN